jgi:hypothetical protein
MSAMYINVYEEYAAFGPFDNCPLCDIDIVEGIVGLDPDWMLRLSFAIRPINAWNSPFIV